MKAIPYDLLGKTISAIWGARRAIRTNVPSHKLGAVVGVLQSISQEVEAADQGSFFRLIGALDSSTHMIELLQRDLDSAYTQSGEPDLEQLGYSIEGALHNLDHVEDELRVWWVRLMCKEAETVKVEPVSNNPLFNVKTDPLSCVHGTTPDPSVSQAMEWFDLMRANEGDLLVSDELLKATEPIKSQVRKPRDA